jgi:hypothetical protein
MLLLMLREKIVFILRKIFIEGRKCENLSHRQSLSAVIGRHRDVEKSSHFLEQQREISASENIRKNAKQFNVVANVIVCSNL